MKLFSSIFYSVQLAIKRLATKHYLLETQTYFEKYLYVTLK